MNVRHVDLDQNQIARSNLSNIGSHVAVKVKIPYNVGLVWWSGGDIYQTIGPQN